MPLIFLILAVILAISGFSAYFIGAKVHSSLVKASNKNARVLSVVTGVVSFLIIITVIFYLILNNIPFGRE